MITEDYCSFELSILLKEKGFDENINTYRDDFIQHGSIVIPLRECVSKDKVKTPTLQMAMKWLRGLYWLNMYPKYNKWLNKWGIVILSLDDREVIKGNTSIQMDGFISYEEAAEAAIKYCLTNLIK